MTHPTLRRLCLAGLPLFASLFVPGFVRNGLSQAWMTPAYSTYTSYSTDGTYIYTSVTVSGTTNGTCPTFPAQLANTCHNTTHKPQVYNVIGSVGGWQYGGSVYWNSYISLTNSQRMLATHGTEYTFTASSEVMCSYVGAIYHDSVADTYLSVVETTAKLTNDLGSGTCLTKDDCLGGVKPRCSIPEVYDGRPCAAGWVCDTLSYRFSKSSPYSCLAPAFCTATTTLPGWCDQ